MRWFHRLWHRRQLEEQLEKELRFHLDQHTAELMARGIDPAEARRQAKLALGGPEQVKEQCRDARGTRWLEDLLRDIRQAWRVLKASPSFTITAVLAIALGIGANTAVFSVVNTVLLKPLPYPDAERIVQFEHLYGAVKDATASPKAFLSRRERTTAFQDISAYWLDHVNLTGGSARELIPAAVVTADFFRLFGAPVLHGRTFTAEEDRPGAAHVAVLSYELWMRDFGADPGIVGRSIALGDVPYTVVGVLGPFDSEQFDQPPAVWVPFQIDPAVKDSRLCFITARLKPGVTLAMARAELQLLDAQERRESPGSMGPKDSSTVEPLRDAMAGDVRPALAALMGAVLFVLLLASTNVAALWLLRATWRMREMAIRAALGAGRARIARQLLTESVVLSLIGSMPGLALGWMGIHALLALYPRTPLGPAAWNPISIPRVGERGAAVMLDWRVLAFTALAALITGVLCGVAPALRVSRADLQMPLQENGGRSSGGPRQNRTLSLLVILQMTLTVVLLIGGGLLIRTSIALGKVNPGFDSQNVLTMQMSLADTRFGRAQGVSQLVEEGVRRIKALPGAQSAAVSCCLPLETVWQLPYIVEGRALRGSFHGFAGWTYVSPEYFDVLRIPLLRGRRFTEQDTKTAPGVILINQTMARQVWPDSDPVGEHLLIGRTMGPQYESDPVRQIIGIVGDVRDQGLDRKPRAIMYVPIAQVPDEVKALEFPLLPMAWLVRTRGKPLALGDAVSNQLRLASGGLPVARIRSMREVASQSTARAQFNTLLMTTFGGAAMLLAAIGMYGLIAYTVQRRMHEIGIRIALGARPQDVMRMMLLEGMRPSLIGVAIGIPLAFALTRFLANLLFGVTARDLMVFVTAPIFLTVVALVAVWVPARRASHIDAMNALRCE